MSSSFRHRISAAALGLVVVVAPAAAQSVTLTGRVTDAATGEALPGANVQLVGTRFGTVADADGQYQLAVPAGTYTLRFTYVGYSSITRPLTLRAGEAATASAAMREDLIGSSEVVVLGGRGGERSVIDSPVPVDVVTSAEIQASGATQTIQLLQALIPSYNAPRPSISDGSDTFRPATLRGLGPDQVLVLINGKRRHTSALVHVNGTVGRGSTGVDLNAIPPSAIDRIEVLRDGAAAQYGSDAIAGVINIILKNSAGGDAELTYGQYYSVREQGYTEAEGLVAGEGAATYNFDGGTERVTHTDGRSVRASAGYGLRPVGGGSYYVTGAFRQQGSTNRANLDFRQQYFTGDSRETAGGDMTSQYGEGELMDLSLFGNGELPLAGGTLYAFGGGSYRTALSPCFFRRANDNRTVRALYPDGFLPKLDNAVTDVSFAGGFKRMYADWQVDLSQTYGQNRFNFGVTNTANVSLGTASPTSFDAGTLGFRQATTNLDAVRLFTVGGLASPVVFAAGAEFRYEGYDIEQGEEKSYQLGTQRVLDGPNAGAAAAAGCQCFPGFSPSNATDENRTSFAAYLSAEATVFTGFQLSLAGRAERYSDFDDPTLDGKVAARYAMGPVAVRGAYSTGFRAPSLAQGYFSSIATNFIGGTPFELGTFPVTSPTAQALGATALQPETSRNVSLGATLSLPSVSLTVDAYQIDIEDRIVFTENFTGAAIQTFLQGRGINASGGRFFTNALNTRTRGLDVSARTGFAAGPGTLRLTLSANVNETQVTNKDEIKTPAAIASLTTTPILGRVEIGRFEHGQPGHTVSAMAQYALRSFGLMARTTTYGEVRDFNANTTGALDQTYSGKTIADVELTFTPSISASRVRPTFALGVNNLLDVYPDKVFKVSSSNGINAYPGVSPFGFSGRYVYARLSTRF